MVNVSELRATARVLRSLAREIGLETDLSPFPTVSEDASRLETAASQLEAAAGELERLRKPDATP